MRGIRSGGVAERDLLVNGVLDPFIRPTGIAIVGASDERYYARSVITNIIAGGCPPERVFPVHPRHATVAGLPCHPDLAAIEGQFDLVVVITRGETVAAIVREAGRRGARAALVLADGFAEQGAAGRALQDELAAAAAEAGVAVLGPNTLGFLAPPEGVVAWAAGELSPPPARGGVGVAFQSSGMLNLFLSLAGHRNLGIRAAFSTGNELTVDVADLVEFFAEDEQTSVIVVVLETTVRPRRLVAALQLARRRAKPVVMLKLGSSERAQRNAVAHTGRMASSASAWEAMLDRLGVTLVDDHDQLIEAAALFDRAPTRKKGTAGAALITISGGDCSLLADIAQRVGLPLADLDPATVAALAQIMEKPDLLGNPLDCENLHQTDRSAFLRAVETLCRDEAVDIVGFRLNLAATPTDRLMDLYREVNRIAADHGVVAVMLSRANEPLDRSWYEFFGELGVPFLPAYGPAVAVMARWCASSSDTRRAAPAVVLDGVPDVVSQPVGSRIASWSDTQDLLKRAGITYAPSLLATTADEAASAVEQLPLPLVAKLISPDAPHKSDVGGVVLGLHEADEAVAAFERMRSIAAERELALEGVEFQAMMQGGLEMILGMKSDPVIGPVLLVGAGGVLAEVAKDVVLDVPGLDEESCRRLIGRLASSPLFHGYRGREPLDVDAFVRMVVSLSDFATSNADGLLELDLNPVLVFPAGRGAVAVDALAVTA